jgi:chemotaxis protein MotA
MDRSTLIGLLLGWGAFVGAVIWEGGGAGALGAFWNPPAFLLVIGGTVGATVLSFPLDRIRALPATLRKAFVAGDGPDFGSVIRTLAGLAERARREGLLALEPDIRRQSDPFLKKGLGLAIDGTDPELLREILETEIAYLQRRHHEGANVLLSMGGFAPTLGVIGTVAGLVFMLLEMSDQESMGRRISGAFIATLYGVSFANLLLLPIGNKLKRRSEAEVLRLEMTVEGILSIQSGDNPRIVEEKLKAFLSPEARRAVRTVVGRK